MKSIVIYYSQTGNTKRIAEAIYSGMKELEKNCEIVRMEEANVQELEDYDLIGLGSPVIDFKEPAIMRDFLDSLPSLKGRYGFTFCTHGTYPFEYIARMVAALRKKGLPVTGWNDWYGSVFIPYMPKPYYTDGHPDEIDLKEAREFGREIMERSERVAKGETKLIPELPEKDKYDKLYGIPLPPKEMPEVVRKTMMEINKYKPVYNAEKCIYPKCTLCIDNCPTHSINLSGVPQISYVTCGPCMVWFCEQLCPTGAIEVDWTPMDEAREAAKSYLGKLAASMIEYKELRGFRSLLTKEEGSDISLCKKKEHPKLVIRDGVVRERN